MYVPTSTYRIQINHSFNLRDLKKILNYLEKLGISTVYSAPFFEARKESVHGYDVVNPLKISSQIGTLSEFEQIAETLKSKGMGWLQDIVPNHMAYDSSNPWLMDIFEKGRHSDFFPFFDIDWNHPDPELNGKVLAPFLGGPLVDVLKNKEVKLEYNQRGFFISYYSLQYPLVWSSYFDVLEKGSKFLEEIKSQDQQDYQEARQLLENFKTVKTSFEDDFIAENCSHYREELFQFYSTQNGEKWVQSALSLFNDNPDLLQDLLGQQMFLLAHWRTTESKINYRRFFTVNDLICLKVEEPQVFNKYHEFIQTLVANNSFQGLRIDHIDGLYNPTEYLERLRSTVGEEQYIVVEKILESEEELQDFWPVQGTSGYEFLSSINRLFTNEKTEEQLSSLYHDFIDQSIKYESLTFEKKSFILLNNMGGELNNLTYQLYNLYELQKKDAQEGLTPNLSFPKLKEALATFLASFSIYRIYGYEFPLSEGEIKVVNEAFTKAESRRTDLNDELEFLKTAFTSFLSDTKDVKKARLKFMKRLQQFSGPLAAKGVEDTVFYIYNRLISHNEVGDSPKLFGSSIEDFHRRMEERQEKLPLSINATSTHDTKRGEDARMRINVLSELNEAWSTEVFNWKSINNKHKIIKEGTAMPDSNDEYFIYQTLIGGWPTGPEEEVSFRERIKAYLIKVVREAKVNSDWSQQNEDYENATQTFIENILSDQEFLSSFTPLVEKAISYGIIYSLAQTVLKITTPGIPDIYQGCELWDLSFVDPDNRRAVDYNQRERYLDEIMAMGTSRSPEFLKDFIDSRMDGKIKLFTLFQGLNLRKQNPEVFSYGEYIPLTFSGIHSSNVVGFARRAGEKWIVTLVPKNISQISSEEEFGVGESVWKNTAVVIPGNAPNFWTNLFTNEKFESIQIQRPVPIHQYVSNEYSEHQFSEEPVIIEDQLQLSEVFGHFPVAILIGENEDSYQ